MQVASEETKRVLGELEELPFKDKGNFDVKNLRALFNLGLMSINRMFLSKIIYDLVFDYFFLLFCVCICILEWLDWLYEV